MTALERWYRILSEALKKFLRRRKLVEKLVNAILTSIVIALARGDRVEIRGFGVFSVKCRGARAGRNPRTGAYVAIDGKSVPFFKTGKELRERLNRPAP